MNKQSFSKVNINKHILQKQLHYMALSISQVFSSFLKQLNGG